jgi:LysM repeat protein
MATHTVQPGETLSGIAQHVGVGLDRLLAANPQIFNPNLIFPGQVISLPSTSAPPPVSGRSKVHVVVAGDTLSGIAAQHGLSLTRLRAANPQIANPNLIFVGQQIVIPGDDEPVGPGTRSLAPGISLSPEPNAFLGFAAVFPHLQVVGERHGTDARILAGIIEQESGFVNFRVHHDGTGHGLAGLDDNGLLPDFERFCGVAPGAFGRGQDARTLNPEQQLEYLATTIAAFTRQFGSRMAAARCWHRGPGRMDDARGFGYQSLIQSHILRLFGVFLS